MYNLVLLLFLFKELEAKIELVTQYTRKGTVKGNEYSFDRIEFNFENRSSSGLIKLCNNKYNVKMHVANLYQLIQNILSIQFSMHRVIHVEWILIILFRI